MPDKIGSFSSGATTSMDVKNGTKENFWGFFLVQNMSHRNSSSAFVSQHTWKWLTVHGSMDPGQQLSCDMVVGCHSLYVSNFDF